jgi:PH (Pleckstrin Homology) domain-containing protein
MNDAAALDLRTTIGYLVADARGKVVGRVECAMYGRTRDIPDALSVRSGFLSRRRRLVPAETIQDIDGSSGVVGLNVERESIRAFL